MGNILSSSDDDDIPIRPLNSRPLSSQSDALIEAQSLRGKARQLRLKAQEASTESQLEYHQGSKSEAKKLSNKKTALYEQMNEKNRQAAALFFKHYNQGREENFIDLHGLYVEEALKYLQQKVHDCRSKNILRLTVITGMGNNSPQKIAKLKPEVENFARRNQLTFITDRGHVVIDLTEQNHYEPTRHQNTDGCIIL